jgi:hypothetical protein
MSSKVLFKAYDGCLSKLPAFPSIHHTLTAPAGIFRASQLRVNPRQRAAHALFKTYLDVLHVAKDEGDRLFRPRGAAGTQVRCSQVGFCLSY